MKYANDASLIQTQPQLIEDLKKAGYTVEAAKLVKIETDSSKFDKVEMFKKFAMSEKRKGTDKVGN